MEDAEDFGDAQEGDEESREVCIFSGLTFLLGREVPQDSLEFVILAGGGNVLRGSEITTEEAASEIITHEIIDRPSQKRKLFSREYAQPQWVYDSFNVRALLPLQHYKPGVKLPPHLSPFVDDEKEGYIPKQREVLRSWGGKVGGEPPVDEAEEGPKEVDENDERELAKIMMTGKTKRLYDTMKRVEGKKDAKNENLRIKRQRLEEKEEA
uniref:BRCT domain-containing protein n=1 Tax=Lotharella oceanica TaxID=641309 RepID=A0A7S2TV49_9EUKA